MEMAAPVGLVIAGAGARGAYEAGALSVLVPRMVRDQAAPNILVGVSAGALNVVGLAGLADKGWDAAADELMRRWASVQLWQVADVLPAVPVDAARYAAQLIGLPVRLPSLLDTRRHRQVLQHLLPLEKLHENIRSGPIDAVAVAATSAGTGGTVVFVEKKPSIPLPPYDPKRNITYVETMLRVEHVMASAAVPVAFRAVQVNPPADGWYLDGGIRLNVPLKPAIAMGCRRLGVVATHPSTWPQRDQVGGDPDLFRAASLSLQALLSDRMVEDLLTLAKVNALVGDAGSVDRYHSIPFLFAGPPPDDARAIGRLANEVFAARYAGLQGLTHPDAWLLDRLIGGSAADHGELLSFLLFEPPFTTQAALLGAQHAEAALPTHADWLTKQLA